MRAEWQSYFANSKPGQKIEWGGGTLTRNADGTATYRALDAMNGGDIFGLDVNFDNVARYNPGIARQLWAQYGFTTDDDQYYFAGNVVRGIQNAINWRVQPGMSGTGWSGQDSQGNYVFDMELMQIWMRDTGTRFDPYAMSVTYTPTAPAPAGVEPVVNVDTGVMVVAPAFVDSPSPTAPVTPTAPGSTPVYTGGSGDNIPQPPPAMTQSGGGGAALLLAAAAALLLG